VDNIITKHKNKELKKGCKIMAFENQTIIATY
jgi:hypothetical protein